MKARITALALIPLALGYAEGCKEDDSLTFAEAREALEEAEVSSQAMSLTSSSIEITTDFTIGQAVEEAAEEIRSFIESQLPCADIQVSKGTVSVEYGAKPGSCFYKGKQFSGSHTITVVRNSEDGTIEVDHVWDELSDGLVTVSGDAEVTWDFGNKTRRVVHELNWTRLRDGREGTGSGDRTQTVLEGGLFEGIKVNGDRSWRGASGTWDLAINDVEMRWVDAVPQSGSYFLRNPKGKGLEVTFVRVDSDTINVTIANGSKDFDFDVTTLPSE